MPDPTALVSPSNLSSPKKEEDIQPGPSVYVARYALDIMPSSSPVKISTDRGMDMENREGQVGLLEEHVEGEDGTAFGGKRFGSECAEMQLSASPMFIASMPPFTAEESISGDENDGIEQSLDGGVIQNEKDIDAEVKESANQSHAQIDGEAIATILPIDHETPFESADNQDHASSNQNETPQEEKAAEQLPVLADTATEETPRGPRERTSIYEIPDSDDDDVCMPPVSPFKPDLARSGSRAETTTTTSIVGAHDLQGVDKHIPPDNGVESLSQVKNNALQQAMFITLEQIKEQDSDSAALGSPHPPAGINTLDVESSRTPQSLRNERLSRTKTTERHRVPKTTSQRSRSLDLDVTSTKGRRQSGRKKSVPTGLDAQFVSWKNLKKDGTMKNNVASTPPAQPHTEIKFEELPYVRRRNFRKHQATDTENVPTTSTVAKQHTEDVLIQSANESSLIAEPKQFSRKKSGPRSVASESAVAAPPEIDNENYHVNTAESTADGMAPSSNSEAYDGATGISHQADTTNANSIELSLESDDIAKASTSNQPSNTANAVEAMSIGYTSTVSSFAEGHLKDNGASNTSKKRQSTDKAEPQLPPLPHAKQQVTSHGTLGPKTSTTDKTSSLSASSKEKISDQDAILTELKTMKIVRTVTTYSLLTNSPYRTQSRHAIYSWSKKLLLYVLDLLKLTQNSSTPQRRL